MGYHRFQLKLKYLSGEKYHEKISYHFISTGGYTFYTPVYYGNIEVHELSDEARKGVPGSFVKLSGVVVHYELSGPEKGEMVVLVHGNAAPYFSWDKNIKALTGAGFRVLRYDLFGFELRLKQMSYMA